jgi:hypothetical protein
MNRDELQALADRIEAASAPDLAISIATLRGLATALPEGEAGPEIRAGLVDSTEAVLALVARVLPGWAVRLEGTALAPNGRWTCTLRRSGSRDDEEVIGIGRAPTPPLAMIAALIRVLIIRKRGYT